MKDSLTISLVFTVLLLASCNGRVNRAAVQMPAGWVPARMPETMAMECANHSRQEWRVQESPMLQIVDAAQQKRATVQLPEGFIRTKEMPGTPIVQKVSDGWLVGFDGGEWGGGLWWWSAMSSSKTKRLTNENVRLFLLRGDEVLVFTGLAHESFDEGQVYSYKLRSGEFGVAANLGSAPGAAVLTQDGSVLVATHKDVLRLTSDNRVEALYRDPERFRMLYPDSVLDDSDLGILVGMRFYVLRLQRAHNSYTPQWYVPSNCNKVELKEFWCECVGDERK